MTTAYLTDDQSPCVNMDNNTHHNCKGQRKSYTKA